MSDSKTDQKPNDPQPSSQAEKKVKKSAAVPDFHLTDNADTEAVFQLDPDSLDPDMHYRFVQVRDQNIAKRLAQGYRFVSAAKDGVRTLNPSTGHDADDQIRVVDTVLMCCPKELFKERRKKNFRLGQARLHGPEESVRKKMQKGGIEEASTREMRG